MPENPISLPAAEVKQSYDTFSNVLSGPVTLHLDSNTSIKDVQAPTVWDGPNGIREWDKKWSVKRGKEDKTRTPLSEYILEQDKLKKMLEVGWKDGIITVDDIKDDPDHPEKFSNYQQRQIIEADGQTRILNTNPFSFLKGGDVNTPPELPKTLTEKQTFDLILLIYSKVTLDPYVDGKSLDGRNVVKKYLGNPYLDDIIEVLGPEVNKYADRSVNFKGQAKWLTAMNIATRKALDAWVLAESHSPTERVLDRLEQRMVVAEGSDQEDPNRFKGEGSMSVNREVQATEKGKTKIEADPTFEVDIMMSRALEVAIPPDALVSMEKEWQHMMNNPDYTKRGDAKVKIEKERQKWEMATLEYFAYERNMPGLDTLANDKRNHFSQDEVNDINDYVRRIGKRVVSLGGLQGEFGKLNPATAHIKKTQDVVTVLLDEQLQQEAKKPLSKKKLTPKDILERKKILTEELNKKVKNLLDKHRRVIGLAYSNTIEETIRNSNILKGLKGDERALVLKVLTDAVKTRDAIDPKLGEDVNLTEGRMARLDRKLGGKKHKVENYAIDLRLEAGLKGTDFMLRNILSRERTVGKEFPGFEKDFDSTGATHLKTTLENAESVPGGILRQNEEVSVTESSLPTGTTAPKGDLDPAKEAKLLKKQNDQAVEIGRVLNLIGVTDRASLEDVLADSFSILEADGTTKIIIPEVYVDSAADLAILSQLREVDAEATIQIDSLNVEIPEGGKTISSLNNFNIDHLVLTGANGESDVNSLNLESSVVRVIQITEGNFIIKVEARPDEIDLSGDREKLLNLIVTSDDLVDMMIDDPFNNGTVFDLGKSSNIEIILEKQGEKRSVIYSNVTEGAGYDLEDAVVGNNIFVLEKRIFKLKPKSEGEAAPTLEPFKEPFMYKSREVIDEMTVPERVKYYQDLLGAETTQKDKRTAVLVIISELLGENITEANGINIRELAEKVKAFRNKSNGELLANGDFQEIVAVVQALQFPEAEEAPRVETPPEGDKVKAAQALIDQARKEPRERKEKTPVAPAPTSTPVPPPIVERELASSAIRPPLPVQKGNSNFPIDRSERPGASSSSATDLPEWLRKARYESISTPSIGDEDILTEGLPDWISQIGNLSNSTSSPTSTSAQSEDEELQEPLTAEEKREDEELKIESKEFAHKLKGHKLDDPSTPVPVAEEESEENLLKPVEEGEDILPESAEFAVAPAGEEKLTLRQRFEKKLGNKKKAQPPEESSQAPPEDESLGSGEEMT